MCSGKNHILHIPPAGYIAVQFTHLTTLGTLKLKHTTLMWNISAPYTLYIILHIDGNTAQQSGTPNSYLQLL